MNDCLFIKKAIFDICMLIIFFNGLYLSDLINNFNFINVKQENNKIRKMQITIKYSLMI